VAWIIRAEQHRAINHHGRRLDLGRGLERPRRLAVCDAHGVQESAQITDEHRLGPDRGRRLADQVAGRVLPFHLAGVEVERDQVAVAAADVDDPAGDRGRRFDDVARIVGPQHFQRGWNGAG
jgi:hypothetical protein